ncbi:hypothetical protein D3C86_1438150 [compost metagenome]
MVRRVSPRWSTTSVPSAISAGIESPIGEPLAMFPPSVPALRIGSEAKRFHISSSSGWAAVSAA